MKRTILLLLSLLLLAGCGGNAAAGSYQQITQEEAKEMMDNQEVIILDVREQDEYDGGSGNRSKTASSALAVLGYTNIYEFGGINTWPYATE